MIRLGKHCSLRNGLYGALEEARLLGCESMQIFTHSPRIWRIKPPSAQDVREFRRYREQLAIYPLIVHTPYLPNLATTQPLLYERSLQALRDDLSIAQEIGADYLVIHPGAYSPESSLEQGIRNISSAMTRILDEVPGTALLLLENVAGGGRRIGSSFAELSAIREQVRRKDRVGVCLDTAHALGAGYDVSKQAGVDAMLREFDRDLGLDCLKMLHLNDSLVPCASRKDRHQHIGKGWIGPAGFKHLLKRLAARVQAGIIETPRDADTDDKENLDLLFRWRSLTLRRKK